MCSCDGDVQYCSQLSSWNTSGDTKHPVALDFSQKWGWLLRGRKNTVVSEREFVSCLLFLNGGQSGKWTAHWSTSSAEGKWKLEREQSDKPRKRLKSPRGIIKSKLLDLSLRAAAADIKSSCRLSVSLIPLARQEKTHLIYVKWKFGAFFWI